jgi:arsenical pump membrane protein
MLASGILALTLGLVLARPWGVSRAWWAALGGWTVLITGLVSIASAVDVLSETADPLALLVGLMLLSAVAEEAGFFDWSASLALRAGGGRVRWLFALVFVVGCLISAVLSLDATAIVLTPIVYGVVSRLKLEPLPFMFACVYAANTASLFLPVSNLTNLLAHDAFGLGFARYALIMLLPATLAVVTNLLVFHWLFRKDLGGFYNPDVPRFTAQNPAFFRTAACAVLVVSAAFFFAPLLGIPVGALALAAGASMAGVALALGWVEPREVVGSVSWDVLALVAGFFLVVRAAEGAGLGALARVAYVASAPWGDLEQILAVASLSALGSNFLNNLPMMLVALDALRPLISGGQLGAEAIYATVVGTGVGPNLTVVGSLATLIWLSIVRGKGVEVTAWDYLKVGAISTPPILLASALGLWFLLRFVGT